jgi:hypothetical protein
MEIYVLYDRSGIYSGRHLGVSLQKGLGDKARVHRGRLTRLEGLLKSGMKFDYIINVGWYKEFNAGGAKVINSPTAIAASSNKRRARKIFSDEGVPAPKLWLDPNDIPEYEFPVIARTTNHSKGSGFWMCRNKAEASKSTFSDTKVGKKKILTKKGNRVWRDRQVEVSGSTHFMKFIPNTREFRVHLVACDHDLGEVEKDDYLVVKLSEKVHSEGGNPNEVIKNHENGWVFSYPKDRKDPILPLIRDTGKLAMSKLGLHWGAVDIMVSLDDGEAYVLEINSSPCLTDDSANTIDKYVKALGSIIGVFPKMEKKSKDKAEKEEVAEPAKPDNRAGIKRLLNKHNL